MTTGMADETNAYALEINPSDNGVVEWRQFEQRVAAFLAAHCQSARVTHDYRQVDPDTGSVRQRDVWIETELGGLEIKVLVSCKRWGRKLFAPDVEHFLGEVLGAGAHLGLLYSHAGFGDTAVKKAQTLGSEKIHCCQLYSDEPTDIPQSLILRRCYCAAPVPQVALVEPVPAEASFALWKDVFAFDETTTDRIKQAFARLSEHASSEIKSKPRIPDAYQCEVWLTNASINCPVKLRLTLGWKFYEGNVKATLLDGTYCLTNGEFIGSQKAPIIDMYGPTPGPAWKLLESQPEFPKAGLIAVLSAPIRDEALNTLASKPVVIVESHNIASTDGTATSSGAC
jgi:Restriction endonuclease